LYRFPRPDESILDVIEKFAFSRCSRAGDKMPIVGGHEMLSRKLAMPLPADLPIDLALRESGDSGVPSVEPQPDNAIRRLSQSIAEQVTSSQGSSR
jgi:ATP-binding protein involved in chromosome partitioning